MYIFKEHKYLNSKTDCGVKNMSTVSSSQENLSLTGYTIPNSYFEIKIIFLNTIFIFRRISASS